MQKIFVSISLLLLGLCASARAQSPPSEAQIRKDVMNPGVIAIVFRGRGSFEKFVTNGAVVNEYYRSITVRRKTDKPGITVDVIGDVVYRLIGGRWVYRTMRLAGNQYGGIKNPTVAQINEALAASEIREFNGDGNIIGEYESLNLADAPDWEWHTPNSVSFNVVAVYHVINPFGRSWADEPDYQPPAGFKSVDKVAAIMRFRIYRKDEKSPWHGAFNRSVVLKQQMPNAAGEMIYRVRLLSRKDYRDEEIARMPRVTKIPLMTQ